MATADAALLAYARQMWPDARKLPDPTLTSLLNVVLEQAVIFASSLPADADTGLVDDDVTSWPERVRLGVVYQARDTWNAVLRDQTDVVGVGDYVIRARPLSGVVLGLWRPKRGRPGVG
jgi:hypothetical protein